jgi:hypothetical protein
MHFEQRFGAKEIKFLLAASRAAEVREWARARLQPDHNAGAADIYRVTSLYFDTGNLDVFNKRGSYGRAKYRVRRYDESPSVFVERKMRTDSLVLKRRSLIELSEMSRISQDSAADSWSGRWFQRRLKARCLHPVCSIGYLRTALTGSHTDGSTIRLTLDRELCAARATGPDFDSPSGGLHFAGSQQILELKYLGSMPAVFKELLETFPVNRAAVSKYRFAAAALGLAARHG